MFAETEIPENRRTFFRVPKQNFPKLESAIAKLSKRSQKAGGWAIELTRFGTLEGKDGRPDCYEVFLDAPDIRLDGYQFVARLDHSQETGNIIRMLPGSDDLPAIYRTAAPKCDHCRINRQRRDTFVLRKEEDGSLIQLGSSCMAEFFVSDPRAVMKLAEIVGYAREAAAASEDDDFLKDGKVTMRDLRVLPLEDYLLHCAAAMRLNRGNFPNMSSYTGFVPSRGGELATKNVGLRSYFASLRALPIGDSDFIDITDEDRVVVAEAMVWVESLADRRDNGDQTLSQFEHNILVVGEASFIEKRAMGLAAAIVGCYKRAMTPVPAPAPVPPPVAINVGDMTGILALFNISKIKWPKITISFPETGELRMSKAGPSAQYPGTINVCSSGGGTWYGRIHLDGRFERTRSSKVEMPEGFEQALYAFAADPAAVAAAYGHRSGRCCFCHLPLSDQRSALVGYGRTCAGNYGLPYPTMRQITKERKEALTALAA